MTFLLTYPLGSIFYSLLKSWPKGIVILRCIIFFSTSMVYSQVIVTDTSIVKALNEDWLIYNKQYATYIPLTNSELPNHKILHQWINVTKYSNYELMVEIPSQSSLFINNMLIERNLSSTTLVKTLAISSLKATYTANFFVSIFNTKPSQQLPNIFIVSIHPHKIDRNNIAKKDFAFKPLIRKPNNINQGSIMIFLLAVVLITFVKNTEVEIASSFFGFKNILSNNLLEDAQLLHIWRVPILIVLYLAALFLAFLSQYSLHSSTFIPNSNYFITQELGNNFKNIITVSLWLFGFLLLKYFFLIILSWFFKQEQLVKIHFFSNIKLLLKCLMVLALGYFIADLSGVVSYKTLAIWWRICLILILLGLLIKNLYITTKITHFRNVYLFSYLCISEILPTLFLVKFLLN